MADRQLVVFAIAEQRCALPRASVRGLLPVPRLWRPPATPAIIAGFANIAGDAVCVLDLLRMFDMAKRRADTERDFYRHLVLVDGVLADRPVALLVDRALSLVGFDAMDLRPVSREASLNGAVQAECDFDGDLVHLLSLDRLLLEVERQGLATLQQAAAARLDAWAVAE
jgi:purine-binding chemotaxis protein CheW